MAVKTKAVEKNIHKYVSDTGYLVSVTFGGVRKTHHADTLEEAREIRERLKEEAIEEGERKRLSEDPRYNPTSWSVSFAVEKAVELCWTEARGGRTAILNARQAVQFFGENTKLSNIEMENIDEYITYLKRQGNSGATINRKLSAFSKVLRIAYERGKLKKKLKMPRMKEAIHRIRFLTPEEETQLLGILVHLGYRTQAEAVKVLLYTGFRCGELWGLQRQDVDLNARTITLWRTKNGHPRTVPIVSSIYQIIERRYMDAEVPTGKLFPNGSNDWLHNAWGRARTIMGLDDDLQFVPHMLRHTCATRLAQGGVSMPVIKSWMGHTTIITTSRYTHFAPSDLRGAADILAASV